MIPGDTCPSCGEGVMEPCPHGGSDLCCSESCGHFEDDFEARVEALADQRAVSS